MAANGFPGMPGGMPGMPGGFDMSALQNVMDVSSPYRANCD